MEKETFIVVGLGNPGAEYTHTHHNAGFEVTTLLANRFHTEITRSMCKGMVGEVSLDSSRRLVICQPQTYMNLSGECVAELLKWYKCPIGNMVVIYDDIDLPAGKLRIRKNGSAGTHNGMRSVVAMTGTNEITRIRVGVGSKPEGWDLADWVLAGCRTPEERVTMTNAFQLACDCVEDMLKNGIDHAMQQYNGKQG